MSVPTIPIILMSQSYRKIFPCAHQELSYWKERAENIPDPELRKQALASIEHKTFHCEGGSIMALMAKSYYHKAIRFIVAYQTISDYLDNLCDRSTSLDPADFAALHEAMKDAITAGRVNGDYYRFRDECDDGNYLFDLVATCREVLAGCSHYDSIKEYLLELCQYYCDLQVHKHVIPADRVPRLQSWFHDHQKNIPKMEWYEFSACSGSTLGIFCLVSYAFNSDFEKHHVRQIRNGYFPYIQGLHILLDYLIDQEEDLAGGDLNFCFYYKNEEQLFSRLNHFIKEADRHTEKLPYKRFHQLINRGLLALYLSDEKVRKQKNVRRLATDMIKVGGPSCFFFFINAIVYRRFQKGASGRSIKSVKKGLARYIG
ncbi:tetraprenyl-beta-curcumene synthase family protein [Bacillus sp. V3B]|uniref:tetraprenyl-beta-curcumene synthase family protein n=1 Tax=Bacillus sp. V3B TaxID=2804915 RepID=UPI00210EC65C|nr:tetraprenyl-beta-curcumene synthase family protein [Bacillus sp. V3B]MCQ6274448.1 tetraprenyl-beta-curcumene synthase family protein [Bacillus sp. V3B]